MALIKIDGLPNFKNGGSFHGKLLNNQRVYLFRPHKQIAQIAHAAKVKLKNFAESPESCRASSHKIDHHKHQIGSPHQLYPSNPKHKTSSERTRLLMLVYADDLMFLAVLA